MFDDEELPEDPKDNFVAGYVVALSYCREVLKTRRRRAAMDELRERLSNTFEKVGLYYLSFKSSLQDNRLDIASFAWRTFCFYLGVLCSFIDVLEVFESVKRRRAMFIKLLFK